jgi:hypothetical protein
MAANGERRRLRNHAPSRPRGRRRSWGGDRGYAGAGRLELKMSSAMSHEPSA